MERSRAAPEAHARPADAGGRDRDLHVDQAGPRGQCRTDRAGRDGGRCRSRGGGRGRAGAGCRKRPPQKELEALLDGEADGNDTFLEINAGAGGTESCDWANMLARMYVRWAEKKGYKVELQSESPGEETGIKSAAYKISGPNAYGWLKSESGVHRLVRISPYDSAAKRRDLVQLGLGLSGGGRQHRDRGEPRRHPHRHLPLVGRGGPARQHHGLGGADHTHPDRDRRDQLGKVAAPEPRHRDEGAEIAALPDGARPSQRRHQRRARSKGDAGWGNQIRSYVLQPYQMVKDLRTQHETSDTKGVLDGDLDPFMAATLALNVSGKSRAEAQRD